MALLTTMLTAIGSSGGGGGGGSSGVIVSPVVAASTTALTVTYANGSAGIGATLTNAGAQTAISLDGVSPTAGQRVLIKDQASALQNGVYLVTTVGSGATNWVLTRTSDFDEPNEMTAGLQVDVVNGTVNATTVWILTASVAAVGTNSVTFVAASDAGYTASRALVTNSAGRAVVATTTATEIGYVNGVTSAIQTQIDGKISQNGAQIFAADSVGTDSYAITLSPALGAYVTGMVINFTAGTANTGAATLAVNGLAAITIKKLHDQDLATGDIEAGQIVTVVYDGTNFQMQSQLAQAGATSQVVLLQSNTSTNSAISEFNALFSASYDYYIFEFFAVIPATDGAILRLQLGTGGTPTYVTANYKWVLNTFGPSYGPVLESSASDSSATIGDGNGGIGVGNAKAGVFGTMTVIGANAASNVVQGQVNNTLFAPSTTDFTSTQGGWTQPAATFTAIKFFFSAGNITSGVIRMYGVKNS